ncbi:MAG: insecticidal toxin complex protein [Lewinellaceae bacterium]|nr:insecticidal toxin complex protein [Lewinellaceae bacterium]
MDNSNPNRPRPGNSRQDQSNISSLTKENATESNAIQIPEISLPKGGGALKGIDEKFEVNAANGTAGFNIPLPVTSGRNGFSPSLSLSYNSGGGNSPFGLGWSVALPSIQRKTEKRLPRYKDGQKGKEDIFMFTGVEDLVPYLKENSPGNWEPLEGTFGGGQYTVKRYRPRIEDGFAKIERISHPTKRTYWKVTTRDNVATIFGRNANSRIADPDNPSKIFQWLPEFSYDDKGNWIQYEYKAEDLANVPETLYEKNRLSGLAMFSNQYLKRIRYGNHKPYYVDPSIWYDPQPPTDSTHFFEVVFDYGEHDLDGPVPQVSSTDPKWNYRPDAFSFFRSGFEIRTNRLCKRMLMFHHFSDERQLVGYKTDGTAIETPFGENYLVRSLDFEYEPSSINNSGQTEVTYLKSISQSGYIRKADGTYAKKSLPPMEFEYQNLDWNRQVRIVDKENIANAPVGLTNNYQWVDLHGEGISGLLTEQGEGWFYKNNYGDVDDDGQVKFASAKKVAPKPSFNGLSTGVLSLQDLEANGLKQMVVSSPDVRGYFELGEEENWKPFQAFAEVLNINLRDPNIRLIDVTGDGQPDIVMSEENVWIWNEAHGIKGHKPAVQTLKTLDEEQGPAIVFADQEQTIFLADMSGDGLTDIVRIRNGEICYWANLGYGRFSAKISMGNAPIFDYPDLFNPLYLHLADVSGTGATDIIYLGKHKFKAFINLSGNAWSDAHEIDPFFPVDPNARLSVVDLLGTGTSCIVWSSDLPAHAEAPLRYMDLMNSKKPHVLVKYVNNFGKETSVRYRSSTYFYLKDKLAGKPWVTKLPFPVQVVSRLEVVDKVTDVRFTSEYRYCHGYYDHPEREFRGFGKVEQIDTEFYEEWAGNNATGKLEKKEILYQAPTLVKTWYHTGAFLGKEKILDQFKEEYWFEEYNRLFPDAPLSVTDPTLPDSIIKAAEVIQDNTILNNLSTDEWREALRACKGMVIRQEVFTLDGPQVKPPNTDFEGTKKYQAQFKPYSVATHNCNIQLLQPRKEALFGVFIVTENEALSIQYERNEIDPRIAHSLNTRIDDLGNILESAAVVYPRQQVNTALPAETQAEQAKLLLTYTRNQFTNDVILDHAYRLRLASESETFEISGVEKSGVLYQLDDLGDLLDSASTLIEYHQSPTPGNTERRKIEHVRTIFCKDDLSGPLSLHALEPVGMPYESYQLAYTLGLFDSIFGGKVAYNDVNMQKGRFVHSEGDGNWWIRSGMVHYYDSGLGEDINTAKQRFYSPLAFEDPFATIAKVNYYKDYFLFIQKTEDALANKVKIEQFNFRALGPQVIRDINDNLSAVLIDELGLVKASAILGKDLDGDGVVELDLTDSLAGLQETTEHETTAIQAFFTTEDSNELDTIGRTLLQQATGRFLYDFDVYQNTGKPVVVAGINRETHHHHLNANQSTKIQLGFEYSDGLGNVVMVKAQAEPGTAKKLSYQTDGSYSVDEIDTGNDFSPPRLRWIGNGRTILNNKGNPVKQYEPFFSVTPHFEDAPELVETGVTPILYYDALGRNIRTELPNGTFSKVEFDAWQQRSFDPNDTVRDSQWYADRNSPDPASATPTDKEELAAWKAAHHHGTPSQVHLDTLGRPILSIEHNRDLNGIDEYFQTRIELDIEGNARAVIDARGNTVMAYQYDMLGHRVLQNSMDSGIRWMLNNVLGLPVIKWDSRGHVFSFNYDILHRPLEAKVEGGDGGDPLNNVYEKAIYGETRANAKQLNLRGQLVEQYDTAGKVEVEAYDIKGAPLKSFRQFAIDYKSISDWVGNLNANLETEKYATELKYDALGRVIESITPDGSITEPGYNEANLLETVKVTQNGNARLFVKNIDYDEKGQRQSITYGNDVKTRYTYDPQTFRLIHLESLFPAGGGAGGGKLQDLYYTYDPVGNISEIEDTSVPTKFFNGQKISGKSNYRYDALYRLIQAEGREHAAQVNHGPTDIWQDLPFLKQYSPGDDLVWRNYTQRYQYDAVGNILEMRHVASGGNWTRTYDYKTQNNRLKTTTVGSLVYNYPHHTAHGFFTAMPHLQVMNWNFRDELQAVAKQQMNTGTPETTYYVYDSSGQRVRKVTENQAQANNTPTKKEERLYMGGIEVYKKHTGNHSGLIRITLHVMDDTRRIAMIDKRNAVNDGTDAKTIRYQLGNHLGSVALEVDENADLISYEEYHPYGTTAYQAANSTIKTASKRYRYTGMERDEESGLAYHGARYYLGWLGRWMKPDPIGIGDGVNVYSYVKNNPNSFSDKNGNQKEEEDNKQSSDSTEVQYNYVWSTGEGSEKLTLPETLPYSVNVTDGAGAIENIDDIPEPPINIDSSELENVKEQLGLFISQNVEFDITFSMGVNTYISSESRSTYIANLNQVSSEAEVFLAQNKNVTMDDISKFFDERITIKNNVKKSQNYASEAFAELFDEVLSSNAKMREAGFDPSTPEGRVNYYVEKEGLSLEVAKKRVISSSGKSNNILKILANPNVKLAGGALAALSVGESIYKISEAPVNQKFETAGREFGAMGGGALGAEMGGVVVIALVASGVLTGGVGTVIGFIIIGGASVGGAAAGEYVGGKVGTYVDEGLWYVSGEFAKVESAIKRGWIPFSGGQYWTPR